MNVPADPTGQMEEVIRSAVMIYAAMMRGEREVRAVRLFVEWEDGVTLNLPVVKPAEKPKGK